MEIRNISVSQINPAPYNPRLDLQPGDEQYESLNRSIQTFGCVEPLVWNRRSGNLVGGHQRFKILLARGDESVDVSVVDLAPEQEKALNLALNKITGDWDPRKLADLLDELTQTPDFDLALTGFEFTEAQALIAEALNPAREDQEETFDLEAELARQGPVVTKTGDLIELGSHRLLCGDCTDLSQVERLIASGGGRKAILFATDPPYLVNYDGTNHPGKRSEGLRKLKRKNKDWSATYGVTWDDASTQPDLYGRFIAAALQEALEPHAAWYCWHASKRQAMLEAEWEKAGAFVHQQILWAKERPVLTRSWYSWAHEPCFMGWVRPHKPPRRSKEVLASVWHVKSAYKPGQTSEHPTSKPIELFEIPMKQHTLPGEVCYEPFCGSGSQIIAAERLGRRCLALEISPRYCDVIVRRYIAFVGEQGVPPEVAERYRRPVETREAPVTRPPSAGATATRKARAARKPAPAGVEVAR